MVSANATLDFLRENGLDRLVDAYGMHVYPWGDRPGSPDAAAGRKARLAQYVMSRCGMEGSKPCWLTEWGFRDEHLACPSNDNARRTLIVEMRRAFDEFIAQKRLAGLIYYAWDEADRSMSIFRCGDLTEGGREALKRF